MKTPDWNAIAGVRKSTGNTINDLFAEGEQIVQQAQLSVQEIQESISQMERTIAGIKK